MCVCVCVCVFLAGWLGLPRLGWGQWAEQKGLMPGFSRPTPSLQTRSSRHTQGAQPGLADQAAKLSYASAESLETMSEAELPLGFSRMNRFRQSLPLSRSASQTKLRSPGTACPSSLLATGSSLCSAHPGILPLSLTASSLLNHLSRKTLAPLPHPIFPPTPPPPISSLQGLSLLSCSLTRLLHLSSLTSLCLRTPFPVPLSLSKPPLSHPLQRPPFPSFPASFISPPHSQFLPQLLRPAIPFPRLDSNLPGVP